VSVGRNKNLSSRLTAKTNEHRKRTEDIYIYIFFILTFVPASLLFV